MYYLSCALLTHSVRLYMYVCRWNRISWQRQQEGRQLSGRQERRMPGACPWQLLLRPRSPFQPFLLIFSLSLSTYLSCLCYLHVLCRVRAKRRSKMSFFFLFFGGSQFGHPSFRLKHSDFLFSFFLGFKFIFEVSLKTFELNLSDWKMFVIPFLFF